MSLSLSSLLNPDPTEPAPAQTSSSPSPTTQRRESLPPISYVQSPERHHTAISPVVSAPPHQLHFAYPSVTARDAAQVLATLHSHHQPPAPPSVHYVHHVANFGEKEHRPALEKGRHTGHGHGASIELPPFPPATGGARAMTSPTLDHYHVAPRSPEQRRASLISPAEAGFSLPPIQRLTSLQQEHAAPAPDREDGRGESRTVNAQPSNTLQNASKGNPLANRHTPLDATRDAASAFGTPRSFTSQLRHYSPPPPLKPSTSHLTTPMDGLSSSPRMVKQEALPTPDASSPAYLRLDLPESSTLKAVASLKNEHGLRVHSPLRDSSMPVPSTETSLSEQPISNPRKRPAPSKKKGTATATKKVPPAKKRKVEPKRSITPSSRASRPSALKTGSSKGTPANSSPAPSTRSNSGEPTHSPDSEDDDDEADNADDGDADGDVYCICRKPDNGTFMIGCDGNCDDWFHGKCVGIEERDKNLIDRYICPNCAKAGVAGCTTWKRICRRHGCRQPARLGKSKAAKDGSKYCSEECGVLFFREMVARAHGREDAGKSRSSRRKGSLVTAVGTAGGNDDDVVGARGGVLAAGEIKSLAQASKTVQEFKRLGDGVLSPPATPPEGLASTKGEHALAAAAESGAPAFTPTEREALAGIAAQKQAARARHQLLKDRMKFVTLVKQAASRAAAEKELKPKEFCGYDPRLEWSEEHFAEWRASALGRQAFEIETLAVEHSGAPSAARGKEEGDSGEEEEEEGADAAALLVGDAVQAQLEVCDRKKCPRHLEWPKLAVDDLRFEMGDNSDRMRGLEKEEKGLWERAALRGEVGGSAVGGGGWAEGEVEVHGLGIVIGDAMEVDGKASADVVEHRGEGWDVDMTAAAATETPVAA